MAVGSRVLVAISDIASEGLLALPALVRLIHSLPNIQIELLAGHESLSFLELLPDKLPVIDEFAFSSPRLRYQALKQRDYQGYLCLSPRSRHRWLGWRLGSKRFSPGLGTRRFWDGEAIGRLSQPWLLRQAYDQVVDDYLQHIRCSSQAVQSPYLHVLPRAQSSFRQKYCVIIHSGLEQPDHLSADQYQQLLSSLNLVADQCEFVLCAANNELPYCQYLAQLLSEQAIDCRVEELDADWPRLAQLVSQTDLLIAEQGPMLWLAGALNVPCVGFAPLPLGGDFLRHPLARDNRCLMFSPPAGRLTQEDISLINMTDSAVRIRQWFHQLTAPLAP
ncbi:glycosyltransferase family 9 protein [Celerinatantimonas yamalensis]|uniref:ADP-heptose:LPS heptosyltransferase n=1 Tax=Celerinatantimonas yamalensis TaxID=559956 RepID=A0ABW9GC11_9GAMM